MSNNLQLPAIKVYDVDYSFIIKNYLDPTMWKRTYNLFAYGDYVFTLRLTEIDVQDNIVRFRVTLRNVFNGESDNEAIYYHIDRSNINMLIRSINSSMYNAIKWVEIYLIHGTDEYKSYQGLEEDEKEKLTDYAEKFLDSEGVKNEDIRCVYIENYIENNATFANKISRYVDGMKYHLLTDLYLVFANSINDEKTVKSVTLAVGSERVNNIIEEIEEYQTYMETQDFQDDMEDNLEGL